MTRKWRTNQQLRSTFGPLSRLQLLVPPTPTHFQLHQRNTTLSSSTTQLIIYFFRLIIFSFFFSCTHFAPTSSSSLRRSFHDILSTSCAASPHPVLVLVTSRHNQLKKFSTEFLRWTCCQTLPAQSCVDREILPPGRTRTFLG
jgi:hypothetical protein